MRITKCQICLTIVLVVGDAGETRGRPVSGNVFNDAHRRLYAGRLFDRSMAVGLQRVRVQCVRDVGARTRCCSSSPWPATSPAETHASLVTGPVAVGDMTLEVSSTTTRQLRTGSAPNPWEVAWVLWHYSDNVHFYYFVAKPNGWELGKADPAYPGAQRFLATGSSPSFPIGPWYRVRMSRPARPFRSS